MTSSNPADEHLVAGDALLAGGVAVGGGVAGGDRRLLDHETALGADRDDDRVLHRLRLHQPEDLGAEVFAPVRPAQPTARDRAEPQVHTLDARRIDEDLESRPRQRQFVDEPRVQLEREHSLLAGRALARHEVVRPQRRLHHRRERAHHPVGVEADERIDVLGDGGGRGLCVALARTCDGSNSASNNSTNARAVCGLSLITASMCDWLYGKPACRRYFAYARRIDDLLPGHPGPQHQFVEPVDLGLTAPDRGDGVGEPLRGLGGLGALGAASGIVG